MNSSNTYRLGYKIKNIINNIFCKFGKKTFLVFSFYILGVICGVIIMSQLVGDFGIDNLINQSLLSFLKRECEWISLFVSFGISYLLLFCYAIFINRATILNIFNICIVFICGFNFGYDFVICISCLNVMAIVLIVILMPIFNILIMSLYCMLVAVRWSIYKERKQYGRICNIEYLYCVRCITWTLICGIVMIMFVYCLLLNSLRLVVVIE